MIVQSDDLVLSTLLVAPTSRSAPARSFRPTITINNEETQVLVEQTSAVAPERLGEFVGRVSHDELSDISEALRLALEQQPSNVTYNSVFRDIHGIAYEPFRIPPKLEEARLHAVN